MAVAQIFELGSEDVPLSTLHEGEHLFGRGELLKCNDLRVSRKHGVLKVTSSGVTITSIHQNPVFYQAANSTTITILPKDTSVDISDGDKFAVLNDHIWFKIKVLNVNVHNKTESTAPNSSVSSRNAEEVFIDNISPLSYTSPPPPSTATDNKDNLEPQRIIQSENDNMEIINEEIRDAPASNQNKKLEDDNQESIKEEIRDVQTFTTEQNQVDKLEDVESPVKKMKYDENKEDIILNTNNGIQSNSLNKFTSQSNVENGRNDYLKSILYSSDEDAENETAQQPVAGNSHSNEVNESENVQAKEDLDKNDDGGGAKAGTSNENQKKDRRDRCWYGEQCFRKNAAHRQEYSHAGDSDYATDSEDNRPTCAYGAACYRRNKEHRREYKHPRNGKKPAPGKRPKKKNNDTLPKKRTARKTYKDSSSEDDYDLEDPFLDDSETEYEATSSDGSDSDSDWSDASEGNKKRLMKEAKKFVKGRKRAKKE